ATLSNCITWNNSGIYITGGSYTVSYSDVPVSGTGNINTNPKFVRTPSPGADAVWGTADDDYGDLRLQSTSPCIDVGSNAAIPAGITTDIRGKNRIIDFPGVGGGAVVDMGAYERALDTTRSGT